MPRRKKVPFNIWETTKENGIENRYIRMGVSQMMHPAMKNLTHLAFRVYEYMKLESGEQLEFEFPKSKWKSFISTGGFQRAKNELITVGFIEVVENNAHRKKANVYRFTTAWKDCK